MSSRRLSLITTLVLAALVPLLTGAVVYLVLQNGARARENTQRVMEIQDNRQRSLRVICAANSAVIDAGRATLTATVGKPNTPFERALEKLGYPPRPARDKAARAAAIAYGRTIARSIQEESGIVGIAKSDGTLDCPQLIRATTAK